MVVWPRDRLGGEPSGQPAGGDLQLDAFAGGRGIYLETLLLWIGLVQFVWSEPDNMINLDGASLDSLTDRIAI